MAAKVATKKAPRKASAEPKPEPDPVPKAGALAITFLGQSWGPVACGEHNAHGEHLSSTDAEDAAPKGWQSSCEACQLQLATVIEHARHNATV
jgi:hypothetical protein